MTVTLDRAFSLAADRLDGLDDAARVRARSLADNGGPLDLKVALDPLSVRTPALTLLSEELEWLITTPGGRLIVSCPPQQGKSELAKHAVLRGLQYNPDWRVAFTSYAEWLAARNAGEVRDLIQAHGSAAVDALTGQPLPDKLGLAVDPARSAESAWRVKGRRGGVIAKGVGSGLTGAPVEFLVCDDPLKDDRDASSATIRGRLYEWWRTVAETRLAPGAPVLVIATRWDEADLSGWLIDNDEDHEWRVVNIPALADGKTPDALNRPPGEWLESARPRSVEAWEQIRKRAGERVFASMYQGRPAPLEGGLFKREWFDTWRVRELPAGCDLPIVVVDPADNSGSGDEAGIMVGCSHPGTRKGYLIDDLSAPMTVGRWTRVALLACARYRAPTLAYERSLSDLKNRVREGWDTLYQQALALQKADGNVDGALARLSRDDDSDDVRDRVRSELAEIAADYRKALDMGPAGPRVKPIHAKGSKRDRMKLIASTFETGRMCLVGEHRKFEYQAVTWQEGQSSPDRVDTGVYLAAIATGTTGIASMGRADTGDRVPTSSTGARRASRSGARIGTRSRR